MLKIKVACFFLGHGVRGETYNCIVTVRCGRFTLEGGVTVRQVHVASDNLRPDW